MKICCISDTHKQHSKLDLPSPLDVETIIHSGDFSGSKKSLHDFLLWYSELPYKNKILVAGNHDVFIEEMGYELVYNLCESLGIIYLQDSSIEIDGINFHGSPWSNTFGLWSFMADESDLENYWNLIPLNTDVLITHGPAYKKGDRVNNNWNNDKHVGSKTLLKRLELLTRLKLHTFGHIHEDYGLHTNENQNFITYNACSFDYYKTELNKALVFEL
jgi:Icc-related predicted phosphoesterase